MGSSAIMDVNLLLDRLDKVKPSGANRWRSCCPAHGGDNATSLQISEVDGRILIHCFAYGCGSTEILESIGLDHSAIYPDDHSPNTNYVKIDPLDEIFIDVFMAKRAQGHIPNAEEKAKFKRLISQ